MTLTHRIRTATPQTAALLLGCAIACAALWGAVLGGVILWVVTL